MGRLVKDFKIDDKWVKYQGSYENQIQTLSSQIWNAMHMRCKSGNEGTANSTYKGCSISENFKDFQFFSEWCQSQEGYGNKTDKGRHWELDKDLILKGNKVYSENICVFIPLEINTAIASSVKNRGEYPIGVHWSKDKSVFVAQINDNGSRKHLGYFKSPEEAFYKYKNAKEVQLKKLAEKYKGLVDERVVDTLMKYNVEVTD